MAAHVRWRAQRAGQVRACHDAGQSTRGSLDRVKGRLCDPGKRSDERCSRSAPTDCKARWSRPISSPLDRREASVRAERWMGAMHSTYQPTNIGLLLPLAYWRLSPLPRLPHQPQVWFVRAMARETRTFAQRLSELTSQRSYENWYEYFSTGFVSTQNLVRPCSVCVKCARKDACV